MDVETRIIELAQQGYECSQIMMIMALELEGAENPGLIRAMNGLNGGLGRSGKVCGCLATGACILGYYGGKGDVEELADPRLSQYIQEYVNWFAEEIGSSYGGTDCEQIIQGNYGLCMTVCMPILVACTEKIMEMLERYRLM